MVAEGDQLAQAMRDCGLGTPATRAAIIETLLAAGKEDLVRQYRLTFQAVVGPTATGAVEELTGRKVMVLTARGAESATAPGSRPAR